MPVGVFLNYIRNISTGRTTMCCIVFKSSVRWRVMRGCDDNSVSLMFAVASVPCEYSMRYSRCWRVPEIFLIPHVNIVGSENFERRYQGRFRKCVRIHPNKQRTGNTLFFPVIGYCLADSQDMVFVKGGIPRCSAVA